MILGHCPLVVDDTRLILGVDSVVAINNLLHFGVLTHKSWLSGQQYSHHLQRGLGRCVGHCAVFRCAGICMEYVPSYLPRVTPPQLDTLWFLVPGSRKTAKHPQLLTRAKQRWQLAAAGSLRDISTHSMVWALMCSLLSNKTWFGCKCLLWKPMDILCTGPGVPISWQRDIDSINFV